MSRAPSPERLICAGRPHVAAGRRSSIELRHSRTILLLDNCEHVRDSAAELADTMRAQCPHVRVIATSRMPLGAEGEVEFPLAPMAIPGRARNGG